MSTMRGLTKFVSDIRYSQTEADVHKRVQVELAKIRSKFASGKAKPYDLKKYTWKLIYMYMLGIDVEIGHMEAVSLVAASKFSEKTAGHIAITLMLNEKMDMLRLVIQSMKKDLNSGKDEIQCLALSTIANIGGEEFAESLSEDVQRLLLSSTSRNFVRKKAALALLRLHRRFPEIIQADTFAPQLKEVLDDPDVGVVTSASSLVLSLVAEDPNSYKCLYPVLVKLLAKMINREVGKGYVYYKTACPWLQVKILRILQYFPPPSDHELAQNLGNRLGTILSTTEVTKSVNKNNSDYSILFEAVNLIIHLNLQGLKVLQSQSLSLLVRFISVREPNIRYLGLEAMAKFTLVTESLPEIRRHLPTIQYSLNQPDISIRRKALDLMFSLCDEETAVGVVEELVNYLAKASFEIKAEMVLKIAILAENYAVDFKWYIDTILRLIFEAGDFVSNDVLYRVVQIVSSQPDLQEYTARTVLEGIKSVHAHEHLVRVGGYLLGEYGHLLEGPDCDGHVQFGILSHHFPLVDDFTKGILLSTYMKLANTWVDLREPVDAVFEQHKTFVNQELQQRSVEYSAMLHNEDQDMMARVWEVMPPWEKKDSALPALLRNKNTETTERNIWVDGDEMPSPSKVSEGEDVEEEELEEEIETEEEEEVETEEEVEEEDTLPPQNVKHLRKLLLEESGLLYESDVVQIGCKMKITGDCKLKMILYFGNKTQDVLEGVELAHPLGALTVQSKPSGPFDVEPGEQAMLMLLWTSNSPFPACPSSTLTFTCGDEEHHLTLRLPLSIMRFGSPISLDPDAFATLWSQHNVEVTVFLDSKAAQKASGDTIRRRLLPGLMLEEVEEADPNPDTVVACGQFQYMSQSTGASKAAPVLVRMEPGDGDLTVTCHSNSRLVNAGIETLLLFIFDPK